SYSARRRSSSTSPTATSRPSSARARPKPLPRPRRARCSRSRRPSQARRHDRLKRDASSHVYAQVRMVPQAAVKVAVVDESDDIVPTAPVADVSAERSPPSRPDAGEARSEWMAGLTVSAVRWIIRLSALLLGLVMWHYASSRSITFYIRFENIP